MLCYHGKNESEGKVVNKWTDAEGNPDWDAYAQEQVEAWEFTEADKKLIDLMAAYDDTRMLLGKEDDTSALWRAIVAADALRAELGLPDNRPKSSKGEQ